MPEILDGITVPATDADDFELKSREASSFYARLIVRVWPICDAFKPERIISWLYKRFEFKGGLGEAKRAISVPQCGLRPKGLKHWPPISSRECRQIRTAGWR